MVRAHISPLAKRILNSNDEEAKEKLVEPRLTGTEFQFEGKTYVVRNLSYYFKNGEIKAEFRR